MNASKTTQQAVDVVVVGSIGLDSIETPTEKRTELLGGSVSYACAAASFYSRVGMVGIIGTDFPDAHVELYRKFGIDLSGLHREPGKTFRWSGVYEQDMINRRTLSTELNVFEKFSPELPAFYRKAPCVMLGNISPDLQLHVLDQMEDAKFVVADTMDLWIRIARDALLKVLSRVDLLMVNDSEARQLAGVHDLRACAQRIRDMGPRTLVIKKGEHGALLFSADGLAIIPAYPVQRVVDPTGAGDAFAGGFIGAVAASPGDLRRIRPALLAGSVVASFAVEGFGVSGLQDLTPARLAARTAELSAMIRIEP